MDGIPTPQPPALPVDRKQVSAMSDFHDRLSPMLVKELRQGLRARTFVTVFLALQIFLSLVLLTAAGGMGASGGGGTTISSIIVFFFAITALVIQPLRGVGALHGEIKSNTIELMVLTRLSAWRIVLGKWIAIYSQTALLFIAIIPYLMLRYFFGGMQLFAELLLIGVIFFLSGVFTALTVGLSAVPSIIVRSLLPVIGALVMLSTIVTYSNSYMFPALVSVFTLEEPGSLVVLLTVVLSGTYLAWSFLGASASMIAPGAENHSTLRRLISLGTLLCVIPIMKRDELPQEPAILLMLVVIVPAVIVAFSETFFLLPPVCAKFLRFGKRGRLAGWFLYPGWPSGTLFSILLVAIGVAMYFIRGNYFATSITVFGLATIGTLFFPGAVLALFHKKVKNRFVTYFITMFCTMGICLAVYVIASSMQDAKPLMWVFCWLPPMAIGLGDIPGVTTDDVCLVSGGFAGLYALISLVAAFSQAGKIQAVEEEAKQIEALP